MEALDLVQARRARVVGVIMGLLFCVSGVLPAFLWPGDALGVRLASSASCLVVGGLWLYLGLAPVSLARSLRTLVVVNLLFLLCVWDVDHLVSQARWAAIYGEVARVVKAGAVDYSAFGSFLDHSLRSGFLFWFGAVGLWILNVLVLIHVVGLEESRAQRPPA